MPAPAPNLLTVPATGAVVVALRPAPPGRSVGADDALYLDVSASQTEVVFQADERGNWTFLNQAWEALTGFPVADTLGRNFLEYVHPDEREATIRMFEDVVSGGRDACRHETRYRTASGGYRWVELTSRLMFDEGGRVVGNTGTVVDIDERRQAEEALRQSEQRRLEVLGRMVQAEDDERRRIATELHDDTIQVMTAALLAIDRQRGALAAGDLDRAVELVERVRTTLSEAVDRTRRLTFELRPPLLDVKGLAAAATELAEQVGEEAGFDVHVTADIPRYPSAIEALAYRTLAELLTNARNHSAASTLELRLEQGGGALLATVRDDGVGFDPAQALDRRRMRLHLGLDATQERVALAGGTLTIDSEPGRGATVAFSLPGRPVDVAAERGVAGPAR
jgi:PAS domain S-box-containing protein